MKRYYVLAASLIVFIASSCEKPATPKNFILIVDLSGSVDTTLTRWYQKTIRDLILPNMGPKDKLIVLPLDRKSQTANKEIFKVDFSRFDYTNEFAGQDENELVRQNHKDSVAVMQESFTEMFSAACAERAEFKGGTDIFGSLMQSTKYVTSKRINYIGILSDMKNDTEQIALNFSVLKDSTKAIKQYIETAPFIDLSHIKVFILTGPQLKMNVEEYSLYHRFWMEYLKNCGSEVIDYSADATVPLETYLQTD